MSAEWITSFRQATIEVDADSLMELMNEIPGTQSCLAEALRELVDNYCFDEIITLMERN